MKIIVPQQVTPAKLTSSNVSETDAPAWSSVTNYHPPDHVIYDHRVYECLLNNTNLLPTAGVLTDPPHWLDLGATNRYKMFDQVISTQTARTGTIEVGIDPGTFVNAVAFFGLAGTEISVSMTDPVEGLVYDETRSLLDNTLIDSWYSYFFEEIVYRSDMVFADLPNYMDGTLSITIDAGLSQAKCGEVVMGRQKKIGVANFGTGVSIQDYSRKDRDAFGNTIITPRAFSKRADYDVTVETKYAAAVQKTLADLRTTPTVYVGDPNRPETVVYGFFKSFTIVLSNPSISECSIDVEGLV